MYFKNWNGTLFTMASWSFLTNHARVLLCIAHDPGVRLRDIAATLGITERSAHGIVTDLADAGYVMKQKDGRRNRYQIQAHLPLPKAGTGQPAIGEVLALLSGAWPARRRTAQAGDPDAGGVRSAEPDPAPGSSRLPGELGYSLRDRARRAQRHIDVTAQIGGDPARDHRVFVAYPHVVRV